jgi:hypothetical protein
VEKFGGENSRFLHRAGIRREFTFLARVLRVNYALAVHAREITKIRTARRGRRMMRKRKNRTA